MDGQRTQSVVTEADGDTKTTTFGADGSRDTFVFEDISDTRGFSSRTSKFDDAGALVSQSSVFDNGSTTEHSFVGGQLTQSVVTEADGDIRTTTFGEDGVRDVLVFEDISDTRGFTSFTRTFDDNGDIINTEFFFDV